MIYGTLIAIFTNSKIKNQFKLGVTCVTCLNNRVSLLSWLDGHRTTSALSANFFSSNVEIFIPLEVYTYVVTACLILLATFSCSVVAAIFKSLRLKMAATVMTVEFGTIHHYSSLEENSEALLVQFFEQMQKSTDHYVNYGLE